MLLFPACFSLKLAIGECVNLCDVGTWIMARLGDYLAHSDTPYPSPKNFQDINPSILNQRTPNLKAQRLYTCTKSHAPKAYDSKHLGPLTHRRLTRGSVRLFALSLESLDRGTVYRYDALGIGARTAQRWVIHLEKKSLHFV